MLLCAEHLLLAAWRWNSRESVRNRPTFQEEAEVGSRDEDESSAANSQRLATAGKDSKEGDLVVFEAFRF